MTKPTTTGIQRIINAFGYSIAGIAAVFKSEAAFRQECVLGILIVPLSFYLGRSGIERAILLGTYLIVLLMEMINSALEACIDRFGGEIHPLSKKAKDIGSALVLVAFILMGATWWLVLFNR